MGNKSKMTKHNVTVQTPDGKREVVKGWPQNRNLAEARQARAFNGSTWSGVVDPRIVPVVMRKNDRGATISRRREPLPLHA